MASKPSSGSVTRSTTSRDAIRSLADEMLRASLTREAVLHTSKSSAATVDSAPPSYHRAAIPALPSSSTRPEPADSLSRKWNPNVCHPSVIDSASTPRDSVSRDNRSDSVSSSSSTTTLSAADVKARVHHLQHEVERVKADVPQRKTGSLFKEACSTDLLFLMDTTGSMANHINAAKEQVRSIVEDIKKSFLNESEVRVAVVSYKDHGDSGNLDLLDFTTSAQQVFEFLGRLYASGGEDAPEDVLGGVKKTVDASWKQQTRCIIHIADAPPHGAGVLHDLGSSSDTYARPGSEPHRLIHGPLLKQLIQLNVNYALLHINSSTDRMGLVFAQAYAAAGADAKLLPTNKYSSEVNGKYPRARYGPWKGSNKKQADVQFEEMELGTSYSQLRHLVVRTVTASVSRTAGRMSLAMSSTPKHSTAGGRIRAMACDLDPIREDGKANLEEDLPQWETPGWLDRTLAVEGFLPDLVTQSANSLNEMMEVDENIKLGVTQLTVHARSKPFAEGSMRIASYARTSASTSKFVVKSFKDDSKKLAHLVEDMRIQALCKAFALEFNGLLNIEPPIDFVVTTCLQVKSPSGSKTSSILSLEPYIPGEYVKYNNNSMYVKEDAAGTPDSFNQIAQAFSHFTFERSWGHFLVNDLQGVGHLLTDPSIQTRDHERFKLADTNLNEAGFKFFFVSHECNPTCHRLGLKSNREMIMSGTFEFREFWPTLEPTVCCSNKLCRRIVRLASTHESKTFRGYHWCDACWEQLRASMVEWICSAPVPNHKFRTSRFFYESQGQLPPQRCPEHIERDRTVSSAAVVGGNLWNRMKASAAKKSISGRSW